MRPVLFDLSDTPELAAPLCAECAIDPGAIELRRFPDEESYVRLRTRVEGRDVVLLGALDRPDERTLPLLFAAEAARAQGARRVGLVAPYLPYLRQDRAFAEGEAVTSVLFARLISQAFDWLVTLDPHLHRYRHLEAVYAIPTQVASAAEPIARWVNANVPRPFLVGPDGESGQWVERVAALAGAPFAVLRKQRRGDAAVEIEGRMEIPAGAAPVIVDDIASTGATLVEAARVLSSWGHPPAVAIVVHALVAGKACERLRQGGVGDLVSTNTIRHASNRIDVGPEIAAAVAKALRAGTRDPAVQRL